MAKTDILNLGGFEYTRAELRKMMRDARKAWDEKAARTPFAVAVRYEHPIRSVCVTLSNHCRLVVPLTLLPEVAKATPKQLADVVLEPEGIGIEWPQLDQQFLVSHLLTEVCGPGTSMRELGRRGGQVKSRAKAKASRQNGLLGGRPRKRRSGKAVVS